MIPLHDTYLIHLDLNANRTIELSDGLELYFDADFDRYKHAVQWGYVRHAPERLSKAFRGHNIAKPGDKIYFHHFIFENKIELNGEKFFYCEHNNAYCIVKDGEIEMLGDWVFLEPAYESEESITSPSGILLKSSPDLIPNVATVRHLPKSVDCQGLQTGDKIHYSKESNYDINIEGKIYFRMKISDILGVYQE